MATAGGVEVGRLLVRLMGDSSSYTRMFQGAVTQANRAMMSIQRAGAKIEAVGTKLKALGTKLTIGVTLPLMLLGGMAVKSFASFDQAMTESTSIMQVTADQTKRMRDQALELSTKAAQGPKDLARSYFYLASAGLDAEQSMAALPQMARFATAGAFDMATATDLATDAQSALGLTAKDATANLTNLTRVTDVLVKANTLANASVQQFSVALTSKAGSALKTYSKDVEEGVAVLAAMADQGIKAELAGNNLARIMLLLSKASRDNAKEHEELGFKVYDSAGKMRNFADIIKNLEDVTRGMSDETKSATLEQLGFEARIQAAILPVIGTSDAIRKYEAELRKAAGTTKDMAGKQMKSFSNQMKVLKNQVTVVAIEIGELLVPSMIRLSERVKELLARWKQISPETKQQIVKYASLAAALGPVVTALGLMTAGVGLGIKSFGMMGVAVTTLIKLLFSLQVAIAVVGFSIKVLLVSTGVGALLVVLGMAAVVVANLVRELWRMPAVQSAIARNADKFLQVWKLVKDTASVLAAALWDAVRAALRFFGLDVTNLDSLGKALTYAIDQFAEFSLQAARWANVLAHNLGITWELIKAVFRAGISYVDDLWSNWMTRLLGHGVATLKALANAFLVHNQMLPRFFRPAIMAIGAMFVAFVKELGRLLQRGFQALPAVVVSFLHTLPAIMLEGAKMAANEFAKLPSLVAKVVKTGALLPVDLAKATAQATGVIGKAQASVMDSALLGIDFDPANALRRGWERGGGTEVARQYGEEMADAIQDPFKNLDLPELFEPSQRTTNAWKEVNRITGDLRNKLPSKVAPGQDQTDDYARMFEEAMASNSVSLASNPVSLDTTQAEQALKDLEKNKVTVPLEFSVGTQALKWGSQEALGQMQAYMAGRGVTTAGEAAAQATKARKGMPSSLPTVEGPTGSGWMRPAEGIQFGEGGKGSRAETIKELSTRLDRLIELGESQLTEGIKIQDLEPAGLGGGT